jgi:tRNA(Ile)-lysidine synthase
LSNNLTIPCTVGQATSDLTSAGGDGVEAAARDARYEFLSRAAGEVGARYVVTAHTADDQIETVLFNILRGTGLAGLAGIPRLRTLTDATTIIRPFLSFTRAEIIAYLAALGQGFRHDESNQTTDYTRNRLRLELLPQLGREYNPRVREALLRLSQAAHQADEFLEQQAETALVSSARKIPHGFDLDLKRLAHLHPTLIRHALTLLWREARWPLQDMSFEKWDCLVALIRQSDPATAAQQHDLPGFIHATRSGSSLRFEQTTR